jgi:hypothetical protein
MSMASQTMRFRRRFRCTWRSQIEGPRNGSGVKLVEVRFQIRGNEWRKVVNVHINR